MPVLANIRPSGERYLMEDFYYAGGLPALMRRLRDLLDLGAPPSPAGTLGEDIAGAEVFNDDVIRPLDNPIYAEGALAVLRGNLAPDGAVIKPSACDPRLLGHRGPALVFDNYAELKRAIDDPDSGRDRRHRAGAAQRRPAGRTRHAGMGHAADPDRSCCKAGVRDMLRISDARMSGTSYGACVLHVAPEAHVGGPLALLRTGDMVAVDVPARRIDMEVAEAELARRRAAWTPPAPRYGRGYGWMYVAPHPAGRPGLRFRLSRDRVRRRRARAGHLLRRQP